MFLDRSDFSETRNSCVSSISKTSGGRFRDYQVIDVVTGELVSTDSCDGKDSQSSSFCGNGKQPSLMRLLPGIDRVKPHIL